MKKTFFILLSLVLIVSLLSCSPAGPAEDSTTPASSPVETVEQTGTDSYKAKIAVLNGTTGFGIAPMVTKMNKGEAVFIDSIDFYSDPSTVAPLIISKSVDIAAVPTNLAATLYNKTEGKIRVIAVNTLGVLYLLENGETVKEISDLSGKTVYVPGQGSNPEYVLKALLKAAGLTDKVQIDNTYSSPDELTTAAATGKADIVLLPEPKVTAVLSKNSSLRVALDISELWESATGSKLVQGCLIATDEFCSSHPMVLSSFLKAYSESVSLFEKDIDAAVSSIVDDAKIVANAELVKKALPRCNIVCLTGDEIKTPLNTYWNALYELLPSAVGGKLPDTSIFLK